MSAESGGIVRILNDPQKLNNQDPYLLLYLHSSLVTVCYSYHSISSCLLLFHTFPTPPPYILLGAAVSVFLHRHYDRQNALLIHVSTINVNSALPPVETKCDDLSVKMSSTLFMKLCALFFYLFIFLKMSHVQTVTSCLFSWSMYGVSVQCVFHLLYPTPVGGSCVWGGHAGSVFPALWRCIVYFHKPWNVWARW